jgi:Domain of unknown function (DUF6532)
MFDKNLPFAHPVFVEVIREQFFSTSRSDNLAMKRMLKENRIPKETIVLVATAVRFYRKISLLFRSLRLTGGKRD